MRPPPAEPAPPPGIAADAPLAQREREYSPSSCIGGNYQPFIEAYRRRSEEARVAAAALGGNWSRQAFGGAPSQGLELCRPRGAAAAPVPLLLFVHGGYWQELSTADSLFAAPACIERGVAFAALDYTLAPAATLEDIVAECRQALAWLAKQAAALGIAADRVVLAGSSAGAHLCAAMAVASDGRMPEQPCIRPRAAVLISGVYWLAPLIGTSIDGALQLDAATAQRASPGSQPLAGFPPSLVCWGETETAAFKAQSRAFAAKLREAGTACEELEVPGRNHFDVVLDLADPSTTLGGWAFARLNRRNDSR